MTRDQPLVPEDIGRRPVSVSFETATKAGEFSGLARVFLLARGERKLAAKTALDQGMARVADVVMKAPIGAMSLTTADALAQYGDVIAAFLQCCPRPVRSIACSAICAGCRRARA